VAEPRLARSLHAGLLASGWLPAACCCCCCCASAVCLLSVSCVPCSLHGAGEGSQAQGAGQAPTISCLMGRSQTAESEMLASSSDDDVRAGFDMFAAHGIGHGSSSGEDELDDSAASSVEVPADRGSAAVSNSGSVDSGDDSPPTEYATLHTSGVPRGGSEGDGDNGGGGADGDGGGEATAAAAAAAPSTLDMSASRSGRYFAQQICKICGAEGHLRAECPERQNLPCFLCGVRGHQAASCPNQLCFACGQPGHLARVCPNRGAARQQWRQKQPSQSARPGASSSSAAAASSLAAGVAAMGSWDSKLPRRGKSTLPHCCFNCGEEGHTGTECEQPKVDQTMTGGGGGGGGAGSGACFQCGVRGHLARDCPQRRGMKGGRWRPAPPGFRSGGGQASYVAARVSGSASRWGRHSDGGGRGGGGGSMRSGGADEDARKRPRSHSTGSSRGGERRRARPSTPRGEPPGQSKVNRSRKGGAKGSQGSMDVTVTLRGGAGHQHTKKKRRTSDKKKKQSKEHSPRDGAQFDKMPAKTRGSEGKKSKKKRKSKNKTPRASI
jgi:cellular nucleic acid-binding protein